MAAGTSSAQEALYARQLAAVTGMHRIPFGMDSYQHASLPLSSKRLLNLYAEAEPSDARSQVAILPTPGLQAWNTFAPGPIIAINSDTPAAVYIVSGTKLWSVPPLIGAAAPVMLGDIGTTDVGRIITIAVSSIAAVVCVPPRAYTTVHGSGVLHQIGGTFPGATSVCQLDGYFIFNGFDPDNNKVFTSYLLDPTQYNSLSFAYSDAFSNSVTRVLSHRGDVWIMGQKGIEIWYDAGGPNFPLARQAGGIIPYALAYPTSVAQADGSVIWIGSDDIVYRSEGYQARRISTNAIERIIRFNGASPNDALTYSQDGHIFYAVTFVNRTLVYDFSTKLWHERSSSADGTMRWRAACSGKYADLTLLGDQSSGTVYMPNPDIGTDAGIPMIRQATNPPLWAGTNRAFMNRVEVEMEVGGTRSPGDVVLDWSDDGGNTFTGTRTMNAGGATDFRKRVYTDRLGSYHQRVLRLTTHGLATFYGMDADITPGVGG